MRSCSGLTGVLNQLVVIRLLDSAIAPQEPNAPAYWRYYFSGLHRRCTYVVVGISDSKTI